MFRRTSPAAPSGSYTPIVHREFKPFTYTNPNPSYPKKETYRAYLTVPRGEVGIPTDAELRLNVNTYTDTAEGSDYRAAVGVVIPFQPTQAEGKKALAQLVDDTGDLIADSTDKVDKVYFVTKPSYSSPAWPSRVVMAYDNQNGKLRTGDLSKRRVQRHSDRK